jgi:hypothetical protein
MFVCLCVTDTHKPKKKREKKADVSPPSDERKKNALLDDTAGAPSNPPPPKKKREITRHVRTIQFPQNAKVVSFRTIRLRVEKRGDSILDFFLKRDQRL